MKRLIDWLNWPSAPSNDLAPWWLALLRLPPTALVAVFLVLRYLMFEFEVFLVECMYGSEVAEEYITKNS